MQELQKEEAAVFGSTSDALAQAIFDRAAKDKKIRSRMSGLPHFFEEGICSESGDKFECERCGKTFNEADPDSSKDSPRPVVKQFECLQCNRRRCGNCTTKTFTVEEVGLFQSIFHSDSHAQKLKYPDYRLCNSQKSAVNKGAVYKPQPVTDDSKYYSEEVALFIYRPDLINAMPKCYEKHKREVDSYRKSLAHFQ
ncbi:hypothetical protein BJ508DRAFT_309381 [Ascobolus immersus RN42]|uniref:Uncharacterized protein n=1 Tax=Ascobolus immersus RN42 TaxID=1160509 RepID=A0A3N4I8Y8_ASCIM|nr:hypothetical protein BJ508DRAFT_309381 [Ascobolus immersus RN42]